MFWGKKDKMLCGVSKYHIVPTKRTKTEWMYRKCQVKSAFCLSLSSASIRILVPQSVLSALQIPQHRDSSVIPARHQRHPAGVHQAQRLPEVQRRRLLPAKRRAVQLGLRQLQHHLVRDLSSAYFPQLLVLHLFSITVKRFVVLTAL